MNEKPRSIWKKSFAGRTAWVVLSLLIILGVFLVALIYALANWEKPVADTFVVGAMVGTIVVVCCLFILYIVLPLSRWLFWKHWRRTLFGFACLVALIVLGYAEENWRGKHDWNKFKREWEAKGERFDMASVRPASVPDEQNFALAPIFVESVKATLGPKNSRRWFGDKFPDNGRTNFTDRLALNTYHNNDWAGIPTNGQWAKATVTDLAGWQAYYRAPIDTSRNPNATNEFPVAAQMQTPAQDVLLALSKYDSAIEELRQASRLPYARFPVGYDDEDPAAILLPHLALVKRSSQALQLRAIAELQNGESEKALADIKLTFRLADTIHAEPFLISHLVRIAILQITMQPIYEGLAKHKWSEAQLAELDGLLAPENFVADYRTAMRGEMIFFQIGCIQYLRRHPQEFFDVAFMGDPTPKGPAFVASMIPSGWFYQNQYRCVRMTEEFFLPAADAGKQTVSPSFVREAGRALEAETKQVTPYNLLERMLMPALTAAVKKFSYAQATVDLARTAIALERYRLAHGNFPESLDALAPQFITPVPHDVIGGGPLKYRRTSDGQFILYSIGWNERDDGGVTGYRKGGSAPDFESGDWVWRYPSKTN